MKPQYWIAIAVSAGVFLLAATCWLNREPQYQGHSLTYWLKGFEDYSTEQQRARSAEAVRHIGTNAMPLLLEELRREPIKRTGWQFYAHNYLNAVHFADLRRFGPRDERRESLIALDAIGTVAGEAAPDLEQLLNEPHPDLRAFLVLGRLGPAGVPVVTRALTNNAKIVRLGARVCLDLMQSHSTILFPTNSTDEKFDRRNVLFNARMIGLAAQEFRESHENESAPAVESPRP